METFINVVFVAVVIGVSSGVLMVLFLNRYNVEVEMAWYRFLAWRRDVRKFRKMGGK